MAIKLQFETIARLSLDVMLDVQALKLNDLRESFIFIHSVNTSRTDEKTFWNGICVLVIRGQLLYCIVQTFTLASVSPAARPLEETRLHTRFCLAQLIDGSR